MNIYIARLKGSNKELAIFELKTLWKTYLNEDIEILQVENTIYRFSSNKVINSDFELFNRITLTNQIFKLVSKAKSFEDSLALIPDDIIKEGESFCLRILNPRNLREGGRVEAWIAGKMWEKLKKPKVSLQNPNLAIFLIKTEIEVLVCIRLFENKKEYLKRMPVKRPAKMPFTLKSDMARVSINFLGIREGIVLDPFCGIGGILLEGIDMGFEMIGNDISWRDLLHTRKNVEYFFEKEAILTVADSKTLFLKKKSIDGIVTDIPYGKSSRRAGLYLYEDFLKLAFWSLKSGGRLVVIYANFVEFKELALKYFTEVFEVSEYMNKSLTRYVLVLEKKDI